MTIYHKIETLFASIGLTQMSSQPNISLPEFLTKEKKNCRGRSEPALLSTLAWVRGVLVVIFLLIVEFALSSTDNTTVSVIFGTLIAMEFFVVLVVAVHAMRKI